MSQIPSGVHSPGMELSPSTTRMMAFFMFAFAVPKLFFTSTGIGVIFGIIEKTYSSTLPSSQSTTPIPPAPTIPTTAAERTLDSNR